MKTSDTFLMDSSGDSRWKFLNSRNFLIVYTIVYFLFLYLRSAGLNVCWLGDEQLLSFNSRHYPLNKTTENDVLYFLVYRLTNLWGKEFYEGARFLNALFLSGSLIFIYKISRLILPVTFSLYITVLSSLAPYNGFSAFFMRESMEFFAFTLLAWYVLKLNRTSSKTELLWASFVLGLCTLVKTSMMFLVPAVFIYISVIFLRSRRIFLNIILICCGYLLGRYLIGYLICGDQIFSLLGPRYQHHVPSEFSFQILINFFINLVGETEGVLYLFALPVIYLICKTPIWWRDKFNDMDIMPNRLFLFTLLCLLFGIFLCALFSGLISVLNIQAHTARLELHSRYFIFIYPLFLISSVYFTIYDMEFNKKQKIIFLAFLLCAIFLIVFKFFPYIIIGFKSPFLWPFSVDNTISPLFINISLIVIYLLFFLQRKAYSIKLYTYVFLPIFFVCSNILYINTVYSREKAPAWIDSIAMAANGLLNNRTDNLVIISNSHAANLRALFTLDNPKIIVKMIHKPSAQKISEFLEVNKNVLVINGDKLDIDGIKTIHGDNFTLYLSNEK